VSNKVTCNVQALVFVAEFEKPKLVQMLIRSLKVHCSY